MARSLKRAFDKIDLSGVKRAFDQFNQTLLEGHYGADKSSIWSFLFKTKNDAPDTAPVIAGNRLFQMSSKTISAKYIWPPLIAVLSLQMQVAGVVALGVAGSSLLAFEYMRCRRMRDEIITEVNVAGQTVQGTRGDLYRLHRAQASILNLSSSFRPASVETTRDTIQDIQRTVDAERTRVKIISAGHYGAGADKYYFSRQLLGLVMLHDAAAQPATGSAAAAAPAPGAVHHLNRGDLAAAFATPAARLSHEEVVERLLSLESALPDDMRQRFRDELSAQPPTPKGQAPRLQAAA